MKRLLLALSVVLAGVLFAADVAPAKFGTLAAGDVVPDFTVIAGDGREMKLSDFRGRILVLNFWATNRGPADALEAAALRYAEMGVVVVGVCSHTTRAEFDAWRAQHQRALAYSLAWDPAGKAKADSVAQKHFGLGVFPATGVIDREGKVVGGFVGFGASASALLRDYLRKAGVPLPEETPPARAAPSPAEPERRTLAAGAVAPDFTNLDRAGKPVKLSDFTGKIVVLDFWATWSEPCLAAMPQVQALAAQAKGQGVVVLAACTSDTREKFEGWLREHGAKYPDIVFANDPAGRGEPAARYAERASVKLYGVAGLPTLFVIGRDGTIVDVIRGYGPGDMRLGQSLARLGVTLAP